MDLQKKNKHIKSLLFCQKFFSLEFSIAVCYFDNALKIKNVAN